MHRVARTALLALAVFPSLAPAPSPEPKAILSLRRSVGGWFLEPHAEYRGLVARNVSLDAKGARFALAVYARDGKGA